MLSNGSKLLCFERTMNPQLFLLILCAVMVNGAVHQLEEKSVKLHGVENVANEVTSCRSVYSCFDCHTASICKPNGKGGFSRTQVIPCPKTRPYCDFIAGTCSTTPDPKCGLKDSFFCSQQGRFPDNNCTIYHECSSNKSEQFVCSAPGQVYNADKQQCDEKASCGHFNCKNKSITVPHSLYPSYYAQCKDGKPRGIYKCPGRYELNETSQSCEPICHEEGNMQDLNDCTKFYRCQKYTPKDTSIKRFHLNCLSGTRFDPSKFLCVDLDTYLPLGGEKPLCEPKTILEGPPPVIKQNPLAVKPFYTTSQSVRVVSPPEKNNFICPSDGVFPDSNCTVIQVCDNLKPTAYACTRPGEKFNPIYMDCDNVTNCGTYQCSSLFEGKKISHSLFPQFYAYCKNKQPVMINKCQGSYELNVTSQKCEATCHKEGAIQDMDDCNKYFLCRIEWVNATTSYMNRTQMRCGRRSVFYPDFATCMNPESVSIPNCEDTTEAPISKCLKQLQPKCRIVPDDGMKRECVVEYLHVGSQPECKEEIKRLMSQIMQKPKKN